MATELMKNIYRIEVPLPQNPMKLLNVYLIKGDDRNLLIDTGFNRPECEEALMGGLDEIGVDYDKTDIFLTHLHADHSGLVAKIKTDKNKLYCSRQDGQIVNSLYDDYYWETMFEQFRIAGLRISKDLAIETHPGVMWRPKKTADGKKIPMDYVEDGDKIKVGDYEFTCIHTPGHSPGHMCLYEETEKIFFAGDMILGDITPNLCPELFAISSLTQYLASLDRVEKMLIDRVFVGHRNMLEDLPGRIASLKQHHADRCKETLEVLAQGPMDAWEVAAQMTWQIDAKDWESFPPSQKWFATGEAYEHLLHLYEKALVIRRYRPDGVEYFELID